MRLSYIIRTDSIETDDRFLKTRHFLEQAEIEVDVFAIVKSKSDRGVQCMEKTLVTRRIFPKLGAHAIKYFELLVRTSWYLALNRNTRWYANFDFIPLHVFSAMLSRRSRRPIWDLHEMPPESFSTNRFLRGLVRWLFSRSNVIVCNDSRRIALERLFDVNLKNALAIRNFPDSNTIDKIQVARARHLSEVDAAEDILTIVIVGGQLPGRFVDESLEVVCALRNAYANLRVKVVGGPVPLKDREFMSATGRIPFSELVENLVKGGISLCFYDTTKLNNLLCEPNRFFQAMVSGQHIISFSHPSLDEFSYPLHHVISRDEFKESLRKIIIDILDNDNNPTAEEWVAISNSYSSNFESQFPNFIRWMDQIYPAVVR